MADDLKKFQLSASDVMKFSFKRSDLSSHDEIAKLVEKENISNKGKWIYVFSGNGLPVLLEKFVDRRKKDTKKFSKANDASANSSCIYVGSSNKLATRIKEHLGGLKSNSTYAIRFKEWLPGDEKITCFYFEVKTQNPNPVYNQDFLQNLEDAMWDQLCPIIGKRGGK